MKFNFTRRRATETHSHQPRSRHDADKEVPSQIYEFFDSSKNIVGKSVFRLTVYDRLGASRQGAAFLCFVRPPLCSTRYGILTNRSAIASSGTDPSLVRKLFRIEANFEASQPAEIISVVLKKEIAQIFFSRSFDVAFLELKPEAHFLHNNKYNFLPLSTTPPGKNLRLLVFRLPHEDSDTARCAYGKVIYQCSDGHFKWDHSVPNLPPGTPLIDCETVKVTGLHKAASDAVANGTADFDSAVNISEIVREMQTSAFFDDPRHSRLLARWNSYRSHTRRQHPRHNSYPQMSAVGHLVQNVANFRNIISSFPHIHEHVSETLDLGNILQSQFIPDYLKNSICTILLKNALSTSNLALLSEPELKKIFPRKDQIAAVTDWKTHAAVADSKMLELDAAHLHSAAKSGDLGVFVALLSIKHQSRIARYYLSEHRDKTNFNNTLLIQATLHGHLPVVEFLVNECEVDVTANDGHELGSTAIHLAAAKGFLNIVAFLTHFEPKLIEAKNNFNDTPLNRAASHGRLRTVKFLVDDKGADIENRGEHGRTPLLMAAAWGHLPVVAYLLNCGADVFAKDTETQSTAGHLSAYFGHSNVVSHLHEHFSELFALKNANGCTPLDRARAEHKIKVVALLEAKSNGA